MAPTKQCYDDGHCYYVYTDAWHIWGRWLMLAVLIAFLLFMIPFSGFLMSLRRRRIGMPPVPGCGWMFKNPYKNAKPQNIDETQLTQRPPRYRAYDPYIQHQRELMLRNEQMRTEQRMNNGYINMDLDTGETDGSFDEKPVTR